MLSGTKVHPYSMTSESSPELSMIRNSDSKYSVATANIEEESQLKEIENAEKERLDFGKWHGMSEIIERIGNAIDTDNRFKGKGKVNGWAILSCVIGVDEVFKRMEENLKLTVLVCGLLLNSALGLVLSPPPKFDTSGSQMAAYISFSISSIGLYLFCILLSIQFLQSMNSCARDADKWRVVLSLDMLPTIIYMIFTAASLCLALAIGFAMIPNYSELAGYLSSSMLILICGFVCYYINQHFFLKVAHVKHGWYKSFNKEYNIAVPYSKLTVLADIDRRYKNIQHSKGI